MKLVIGTDDIFACPEGRFRGIIERIGEPKKRINKPCEQQVRMTIRVKTTSGKEHLVARTFCADLSFNSELYHFLDSWLDGDFERFADGDGQLDMNLLLGKEVDVLVSHFDDGTHGKPFVKIDGIFPRGKLVQD